MHDHNFFFYPEHWLQYYVNRNQVGKMHWIDITIFMVYMVAILGVVYFFIKSNSSKEDYYLAGRNMGPWHIGFSVVATDVWGGFSIGLGGLGFVMGLSGSWMLFSGLVGAWLAAVFLIPKVFDLGRKVNLFTSS